MLLLALPLLSGCALMRPAGPYAEPKPAHGQTSPMQVGSEPAAVPTTALEAREAAPSSGNRIGPDGAAEADSPIGPGDAAESDSRVAPRGAPRGAPGGAPGGLFGRHHALDLEAALEIALAHNPTLAAAGWEGEAARARRDAAAGERWPRFGVVGTYTHHLDEQRLLPVRQPGDPSVLSRDIVSGDLVLSMPLFTGGRLGHQIRGAGLLVEAARGRVLRTREEIISRVSSLFFAILAQEKVIESLEFARGTMEEQLRRIDALIQAQKAAGVDRLRSEVRLADVDQQLARERGRLAIGRRALLHMLGLESGADSLFNMLGLESGADSLVLRGDLEERRERALPELETAMEQALSLRTDYQAARAALEARARDVDAARAGHWPQVFLQGSYGGRWAIGSWTGDGEELDDIGRIGLAIEMPVFDGGRIAARVREQRALLAADRERLHRLELEIRLEVETALLNVTSTRERAGALAKVIDQAQESLRIEREKYALGKGAIVDVLDAQAALLESETNYYLVLSELQTALAELRLAIGEP